MHVAMGHARKAGKPLSQFTFSLPLDYLCALSWEIKVVWKVKNVTVWFSVKKRLFLMEGKMVKYGECKTKVMGIDGFKATT